MSGYGGIIGGIAGAAIAYFTFGAGFAVSAGFLLGSLVGNLIDPVKVQGQQPYDLKLQRSAYGAFITIIYGTDRVAGNVFWQADEVWHKQKTGGKGGPPAGESWAPSVSFAILIGEGPILGIREILANGELVYSGGEPTEDFHFTLYLGDALQDPDPTMEAGEGVGEVPDYRGYAYIVFDDLMVGKFGNHLPNLEMVVEATGDPIIERISTYDVPTPNGYIGAGQNAIGGSWLEGSEVLTAVYTDDSTTITYQEFRYRLSDGELLDSSQQVFATVPSHSLWVSFNSDIAAVATTGSTWVRKGAIGALIGAPSGYLSGVDAFEVHGRPLLHGDYVYACGGNISLGDCYLAKWGIISGEIVGAPETDTFNLETNSSVINVDSATIGLAVGDDGYLYAVHPTPTQGADHVEMWQIDPADLSLVRHWADIAPPAGKYLNDSSNSATFTVFRGMILAADLATIPNATARLLTINDDDTFTEVDSTPFAYAVSFSPMLSLGGGYALCEDGVLRIGSLTTYAAAVAAISEWGETGLTSPDYDVTDIGQPLRGYHIGALMTKFNAVDPLRKGDLFGCAEVDDVAVFRRYNHASEVTIPDADLAASDDGSETPAKMRIVHVPDAELPRRVTVKHINPNDAYGPGTQYATRATGASTADVVIDLPIVMTENEAKALAETHISREELESERLTIWLTRKWAKIAPSNTITAYGRQCRIVNRKFTLGGVIELEALPSRAVIFDQPDAGVGGGSGQAGTPPSIVPRAATESVLLDIPNLSQKDSPFGFKWAAGKNGYGDWPGASLNKSTDGGTTWTVVATTDSPSVIGVATGELDDYTGGDVLDTVSATLRITLTDKDAALTTCAMDALDAGANLFALRSGGGWEIGQFLNSTPISANVFDIDTFYRGRKGTAGFNAGHAAGDQFVLLTDETASVMVVDVDAPEIELNVALLYKAVTFGGALSSAVAVTFTNTGNQTDSFYDTEAGHIPVRVTTHTGTSYTFVETDRATIHPFSNAGTITVTLPTGLKAGWWAYIENIGDGDLVIDPVGANLDGAGTSLTLPTDNGIVLQFDGTDYWTMRGIAGASASSPLTTKGDLYTHTTVDARLGVGSNDQTLIADSTQATGLRWGTPVGTVQTPSADYGGDTWRARQAIRQCIFATSATPSQFGTQFATATTFAANTSASYLASLRFGQYNTLSIANAQIIAVDSNQYFWRGNATGLGGFRAEITGGVKQTQTTMRLAFGLFPSNLDLTSTFDPSTLISTILLGTDAADANMQIMHNDGTGTCTKIDLGSGYPKTSGVVYRVVFACAPNAGTITYEVTRMDVQPNTTTSGTLSTNLPANTQFMQPSLGWGNGATAAVVQGAFVRFYSEQ